MGIKLPNELMFLKNRKEIQKQSNENMQGKIVLISGSTSGVGYEALKRYAQAKANLIMVCRNAEKARQIKSEIENLYSVSVDYFIADFSDLDQVRLAAKAIIEKYPHIDVLINSTGLHSTKKLYNQDGYELVFTVNHLAPFLFTQLLLSTMINSSPSRIIQVNSEGHRFNGLKINDLGFQKRLYTGLKSYGQSKTAQLLTVWQMATDLASTGVTINAMHPGGVRTNIGNNNGRLYRWFLHHVTWHFLKDPIISGEALFYLGSFPDLQNVTGKFFNLTIEEIPAKHALNPVLQKQIWDKSVEMTQLLKKDV